MAGIGHGFGTQRLGSQDVRAQNNGSKNNRVASVNKNNVSSLNATQTSHKQQVNNFFSLGSGTNSKTAVGLNSSIGNISSAQGARTGGR